MHHPAIVLLFVLLIVLFAPLIGQGLGSLGSVVGPALSAAPGVATLSHLVAPALVVLILAFGALVVGVVKIVAGV